MSQLLFSSVHAGVPHSADEQGEVFDLADYLVRRPEQTFYVRVEGDSMQGVGICDGDILVVDQSLVPQPSNIVVAETDGGYTVKQFKRERGNLRLVPANDAHCPIEIDAYTRLCGVAKFVIHRL